MPLSLRSLHPLGVLFGSIGLACASSGQAPPEPRTPAPAPSSRTSPAVQPAALTSVVTSTAGLLPRGLTSFGAAATDDALYVLGGYFGEPHAYSREGQSGDLLRLDRHAGTWSRVGSIEPAQSIALVAHGRRLVRVGGMQATNAAGEDANLRSQDLVAAFDIDTGTWAALPSLPQPRSSHDAVLIGDTLWVVGGWTLDGGSTTWCDTIAALDLSSGSVSDARWVEHAAPFSRRALAAATAGGLLVALGGMDSAGKPTGAVDVFDPSTGRWRRGPDFPGKGFGMAATSEGGAIVATGMDGAVHRFTPGEDQWRSGGTLAYPRFFHRLVPTPNAGVLAVGGIRGMAADARVRPIEPLPPPGDAPKPRTLEFELPSPLPSKNRQGVAVVEDTLYVFGGNKSLGQHDFGPEFFTDEAAALDLLTMQWRPIAPYPEKRQTMSTFVAPWGQIVSIGGFGHDGEVARTHPEVFAYHPSKDAWTEIGRLPGQGRTQFGLALRDDEVVLFGGLDYDPRRPEADRFRHEVDLLSAPVRPHDMNFDDTGTSLPRPRRAFAGALLGDTYYLVGGMREGFDLVQTCDAYDFTKGSWRTIACPNHARLSARLVALGDALYVAAGSSPDDAGDLAPDPSLEVYDPATDTWTLVLDQLPIEPRHMHMLAYRDRLLLFSTHDEGATARLVLVAPS